MAFIPDYSDRLDRQKNTPGAGDRTDGVFNNYMPNFGRHSTETDDRNDQPVVPGFGNPIDIDFDIGVGFGDDRRFEPPKPIVLYGTGPVFSDEGGDLVTLTGTLPKGLYDYYYIRLKRAMAGAEETIHPTVGYCYSAVGGRLYDVYPAKAGDRVTFGLPPLPLGLYKVLFYDGPSGKLLKQTSWLLKIERRRRSRCTYRTRDRFPPLYLTGPSRLNDEGAYPKP